MPPRSSVQRKGRAAGWVIFAAVLCAVLVLSILRIVALNRQFPAPTIVERQMMEAIQGGEIQLTFQEYALTDCAEFRKTFPEYHSAVLNIDMSPLSDDQQYILTASVHVKNTGMKEQVASLVQIYAESLAWSNGIDAQIYQLLNSDFKDPMRISLQPGEECNLVLPYSLYNFQFSKDEWLNVEKRAFDLVLSFYPVRTIVPLLS